MRSIALYIIFGAAFGAWIMYSLRAEPGTTASSPVVDSTTAATTSGGNEASMTPVESTATTLYVHGAITDADGCEDVAVNGTVAGKFYRTNHLNGDLCSPDNNDCYVLNNANCTKTACGGPGDLSFNYECVAQIQYYADSTITGPHSGTYWTAKITATDASTATGSNTDTIEMESTVGLDASPAIDYGSLSLDGQSSQKELTVTNSGNTGIDISMSADAAMTCATGVIPMGNTHYSITSGFSYASGTALTASPTEYEFDLAQRTNDSASSTKNMYFILKIPITGAGGTCTNALTVSAGADTENGW